MNFSIYPNPSTIKTIVENPSFDGHQKYELLTALDLSASRFKIEDSYENADNYNFRRPNSTTSSYYSSSSTSNSDGDSSSNTSNHGDEDPYKPFLEVSTKFENYLGCLDCNTNFLTRQKYNEHIEYCGTPQFFYGTSHFSPIRSYRNEQLRYHKGLLSPRKTRVDFDNEKRSQQQTRRRPPPKRQQQKNKSIEVSSSSTTSSSSISNGTLSSSRNKSETARTTTSSTTNSTVTQSEVETKTENVSDISNEVTTVAAKISNSPRNSHESAGMLKPVKIEEGVEIYECKVCFKTYNTRYGFKLHLRTHTGERRYNCEICAKKFTQSGHLKDHLRIHTGEKPFICNIAGCGRRFAQNQNLKHHLRQHQGPRPWKCPDCQKSYFTKCELTSHSRNHTGVKPYSCMICKKLQITKLFANYKNLKTHLKNHTDKLHPDSAYINPHQCEMCGEIFEDEYCLMDHAKVQNGGHLGGRKYMGDDNEMIEVEDIIHEVVVE